MKGANIYLDLKKTSAKYEEELIFLKVILKGCSNSIKKKLLCCNNIDLVARIYNWFVEELDKMCYEGNIITNQN
jgi:hypothetical protein